MSKLTTIFCIMSLAACQTIWPAQPSGFAAAAAETPITLITKDKKKYKLPRNLVAKLEVIATAVEGDPKAKQVPVPGINFADLELLVNTLIEQDRLKNLTEIKEALTKAVTVDNINKIYFAADYLGIERNSDFFKALAQRYAELLHDFLSLTEEARKKARIDVLNKAKTELVNAKYYLPEIAKQYYLKYGEDIDSQLGVKGNKPTVQELHAAGLLDAEIVRLFPNLDKAPNESFTTGPLDRRTAMDFAIMKKDINSISSLLRLGFIPLDRNYVAQVAQRMTLPDENKKAIAATKLLVEKGAPFDQVDSDNYTPLVRTLYNGINWSASMEYAEYLLRLGATPGALLHPCMEPIKKSLTDEPDNMEYAEYLLRLGARPGGLLQWMESIKKQSYFTKKAIEPWEEEKRQWILKRVEARIELLKKYGCTGSSCVIS